MADTPRRKLAELDARMLRALAHPLRVRMLELLREHGPATASGLAQRVGESSGTTSWHLRQLAVHGFVEEDTGRGNRRERWWRPIHAGDRLQGTEFLDNPELAGPFTTYLHAVVEQRYAAESRFVTEIPRWEHQWRDSAFFDNVALSLTPEENVELNNEVRAVVDRYRREPRDGDTPVRAHWAAFPRGAEPERA
jgi:DNA-binding transcriptional ArsR family regulator